MDKKLLLLKFIASTLALLSIFYSVYIVPLFIGFMIYMYPMIYADGKRKLKYKTPEIIKLLKIDNIASGLGITYLITIVAITSHMVELNSFMYIPLVICLLPMIYADLRRRRLLKYEEIKEMTY